MVREKRVGLGTGTTTALLRLAGLSVVCVALVGCASGVAAGIAAAAVTVGFVTRTCYDHVHIKVFDGVTGHKSCKANVTAGIGDDLTTLDSCYYAQLSEGTWTVSASYPGYVTETTTVVVPERKGCPHAIHSIEMTLKPPHVQAPPLTVSTPTPATPPLPPPAPSTEPAPPPSASTPAAPVPATVPSAPAPATAPSAPAPPPQAPPVQRFPEP